MEGVGLLEVEDVVDVLVAVVVTVVAFRDVVVVGVVVLVVLFCAVVVVFWSADVVVGVVLVVDVVVVVLVSWSNLGLTVELSVSASGHIFSSVSIPSKAKPGTSV